MADDAAEVADDYRQALEDLSMNSRIEIATLTNIARENANHGLAIAEVLQNHIKKVPPQKTLPALYVLDSVVKNVPTPYSLYFAPKLYSIFMGAYTKVDKDTRRKMDEMLRTWKEPVPGSISTKPVFPPEFTRPIEQALIAARNAAFAANQTSFQGQQQLLRGRPPVRDTPTPPTNRPPPHTAMAHGQQPYPRPPAQMPPQQMAQHPYPIRSHDDLNMQQPQQSTSQPAPAPIPVPSYAQHQQMPGVGQQTGYGLPQPGISIDKLKDDIQQLIVAESAEFARNPLDASRQTTLNGLLELQKIIQTQGVTQDQLMLIKERVAELAVNNLRGAAYAPPLTQHHQPHQYYAPMGGVAATHTPPPVAAVARPPSTTPAQGGIGGGGLSLGALLEQKGQKGSLAALLAAKQAAAPTILGSAVPPPATNTPPQAYPAHFPPQAVPPPAAVRPPSLPQGPPYGLPQAVQPLPVLVKPEEVKPSPAELLARLRQSHALPGTEQVGSETKPHTTSLMDMLRKKGLLKADVKPKKQSYHSARFSQASLKQYRPPQAYLLTDDLGVPCAQCGRRFRNDDDGRRQKTAHMDWHFRVHQRMAESEKRGIYHSPYVDEMDWIQTPITVDLDYLHAAGADADDNGQDAGAGITSNNQGGGGGGGGGQKNAGSGNKQRLQYLAVPDDASRVNSVCPICQETFEMKWLDEAQEWVWMDAVKLGERVFHASCHREVSGGGRGGTPPDGRGVKRKAEDDFQGARKMGGGY